MGSYKLKIEGGRKLEGETYVSGGKNTAVAVIPAVLLCDEPCEIDNLPDIEDVRVLIDILKELGAQVEYDAERRHIAIDPRGVTQCRVSSEQSQRMRASYYFLGALLGRFGEAQVGYPGGCNIGSRPVDQHLKAFEALGAADLSDTEYLHVKGELKPGRRVVFDKITVGGTMNAMLAAARIPGKTVLYNTAREPHIVDLANFLSSMGATVVGAGTNTIRITGCPKLHHSSYTIIPDQIETGTLMIAAAATHGIVTICGCIPTHMEALSCKLLEMGVMVDEEDDRITIRPARKRYRAVNIKTEEYPGFPTDLQQPISMLLTTCEGCSKIEETIFSNRFRQLNEVEKMGAQVLVNGQLAMINGVEKLHGATLEATDLRAGAALVIAGLMSEGTTLITNTEYIERGYEHIEEKLRILGAVISRV